MLVAQLCPTLCDPMDCSPPGSSVHGIVQARTLEWVATPFSRGSSHVSNSVLLHCRHILYHLEPPGKPIWKLSYNPKIPILDVHPEETKPYVHTKTCTQIPTVALFTNAKKWRKPNVHKLMNGLNMVQFTFFKQWNIIWP